MYQHVKYPYPGDEIGYDRRSLLQGDEARPALAFLRHTLKIRLQ
jgi:hypothetical protein